MSSRREVLIVGLGTIARTHHEVLREEPGFEIVGAVDPAPGFDPGAPVYASIDEALASAIEPDLVVVATPTATHVDLVGDLLGRTEATVLSEKPLAATVAGIRQLERTFGPEVVGSRVKVAHHFAFSPEVEWARRLVAQNPQWGPPTRIDSVYNDAYAGLPDHRRTSYVSSWIDSGPNQLSVVAAFATGWTVRSHVGQDERAVTLLDHEGGRTTLSSNWLAAGTSKQTTLEFGHAAVELRLDHTSMTAMATHAGSVTNHVGYTGASSRKAAHYLGVYRALLTDPDDSRLSVDLAAAIAEVLEAAVTEAPAGHLAWETIDDQVRPPARGGGRVATPNAGGGHGPRP